MLPGCPEVDNPYRPLPEPDFAGFGPAIQPIVASRCAATACHGSTDRVMTLYAVGYLRAAGSFPGTPLSAELSDGELAWNYDALRIRLFGASDPDDSLLLRKCLPPALGGIRHADGEVVFTDRDELDYQILRQWATKGVQ